MMATDKIRGFDVVDGFVDEIGVANYLNADNYTLQQLLDYGSTIGYKTFVFRIDWTSAISPDRSNCSGIGTYGCVYVLTGTGKLFMCSDANVGWIDITGQFLPLTGGTLSGSVNILTNGMKAMLDTWGVGAVISTTTADGTNRKSLAIRSNESLIDSVQLEDSSRWYRLFGEHNKPSGTYTGNGDATERTINVGGFGGIVYIIGANWCSLVGYYGALCCKPSSGTIEVLNDNVIKFSNGIITMNTGSDRFNSNSLTYNYYLI